MPASPTSRSPGWVQRSIVLGSSLGLLETAFVYATGFAPLYDFLVIWGSDLLLCSLWGLGLAKGATTVGRCLNRSFPAHGRLRDLGLLLFPALLFALRGNVDPNQVNHPWAGPARWGVTLAVMLVVVADALVERAHLNEPMSPTRFALVTWLSTLAPVAGFATRTQDLTNSRDFVVSDSSGRVAITVVALLLPAVLVWVWDRRMIRQASSVTPELVWTLALFTISGGLALMLRTEPPRLSSAASSPATNQSATHGPSVLLVVLDTVRQDHVSAYGYSRRTTPNLDIFAQTAILFDAARAASTYSLSTHASLFTGLPPSRHGAHPIPPEAVRDDTAKLGQYRLNPSVDTLAEDLRGRGYATAGISGNDVFLAPWTGLQRGFAEFTCEAKRFYRYVPTVVPLIVRLSPTARRVLPTRAEWSAESITEGALEWLARSSGRPFFLFLNYFDAHAPYTPLPPYDRMFPAPTGDQRAEWISQYDGEIAYTDVWLARLLQGLREQGRFDETLIIVTADHGEFFGEHGLFDHRDLLYEPVLRVPLIIKLPWQREALRSSACVAQWQIREIVRRVLDGVTTPQALVAELDMPKPKLMAESWNPGPGAVRTRLPASTPRSRAVYLGPFKLVERVGAPDWLFHLPSDPYEEHDLFAKEPELVRALQIRARQAVGRLNAATEDLEVPVLDEGVLERLRSLGYLGAPPGRTGTPQR